MSVPSNAVFDGFEYAIHTPAASVRTPASCAAVLTITCRRPSWRFTVRALVVLWADRPRSR